MILVLVDIALGLGHIDHKFIVPGARIYEGVTNVPAQFALADLTGAAEAPTMLSAMGP